MSIWRKAPRKDGPHQAIVEALRAAGASVVSLNAKGVPDLLVGHRCPKTGATRNLLLEVKAPLGPRGGRSHRDLNEDQQVFHRAWRGDPPFVVRSVPEALAVLGYHLEDA